MTIGRRYELLMAVAARGIPEARRKELLDAVSIELECTFYDLSIEERFWVFGSMMLLAMKPYSDQVGEIAREMFVDPPLEGPHGKN
jgi:hypothetical protein